MSKSLKITLFLIFCGPILRGQNGYQNLVVNPSFEQRIVNVPPRTVDMTDSIEEFVGWRSPTGYRAFVATTDPTTSLIIFDFEPGQRDFKAKTGKNAAFIDPYGWQSSRSIGKTPEKRSYLEGELTEPLTVGQKYYVGFSIHFHCLATNNVGIAFGFPKEVKDTSVRLRLKPVAAQRFGVNYDKKNLWTFVVDSFVAEEAYTHCYIGNFLGNDSTATNGSIQFGHYVAFIDDAFVLKAKTASMPPKKVVVKPVPPLPKVLNSVQFKVNSTDFEANAFAQLDSAALTLINFPKLQILIKGHTSREGNADNNQRLSERRAEAVKNYLINKGITANRLETKGFGATQPIAAETTEENRRLNRRIEFEIIAE